MKSVKLFYTFSRKCQIFLHKFVSDSNKKTLKSHEKLINYLNMSPLVKNIVKGVVAVAGAFLVYTGVKKVAPTALPVDPFAGSTSKTWLWLAGFVAVGAAVMALIGRITKISILKN